jgi:hypothetical protein
MISWKTVSDSITNNFESRILWNANKNRINKTATAAMNRVHGKESAAIACNII